jgi:hypothetical protein
MFRIALPSEDSFLLLAPRWSGWGEFGQTAALAGLLFVPLMLMVALYRYEMTLVARRSAATLLLLRVVGLLVLWGLAGLQPTVAQVEHEETRSRVLVAIDVSASMDLADPQRTWAEKLRLAQALQLSPDMGQLARWLEVADQATPPRDARTDAMSRTVDRLTRKDIARRLLESYPVDLLVRLRRQHHVEAVGFHQDLTDGSDESLAALFQRPENPVSEQGTNLGLPLQRALQANNRQSGKLLGVILLTDGQHNQGLSPLELAKELARQQIPVYPIALGSRQPPIDLAVLDVQAPKQVFKDAEATVEAKIRATGLPAQDLFVELHGGGKFGKQDKIIRHDGKDHVYTTNFLIKLSEIGTQRLEVRVRPQNSDTRELTIDNNRLATVVRVAPEKARILIVDDEPRWEYHYLASALARDPDLQLDRVLLGQPRLGTLAEDQLEKLGHPRRQIPAKEGTAEDPLWQYDCIVIGDLAPEQLPTPERIRLERYVADRGGTLVVVAGKRNMPLAYFAGAGDDPFVKLLPLQQPNAAQPKEGFEFSVTELGAKTPFFQIDKNADLSRLRWAEMPKHFWGVTGVAKPGAVVLARAESPEMPKYKDAASDPAGLVLQQPYGFGKALYVGVDSTWRWRYRVGDLYHHRFWGQVMRWAVADAWLPEGNRYVRYGAKAPIYRHDQEVEVTARLGGDAPPVKAATAKIKLIRAEEGKGDAVTSLPLAQDEHRLKQWTGKIKQLPPGHYRLELDIPELRGRLAEADGAAKTAPSHGFTVMPPENGELIDVATNWALLQALADQTHGRLFTAEDAAGLSELLAGQVQRKETQLEQRIWRDQPAVWWVLGVLLTLLTAEWVLRKLWGLP